MEVDQETSMVMGYFGLPAIIKTHAETGHEIIQTPAVQSTSEPVFVVAGNAVDEVIQAVASIQKPPNSKPISKTPNPNRKRTRSGNDEAHNSDFTAPKPRRRRPNVTSEEPGGIAVRERNTSLSSNDVINDVINAALSDVKDFDFDLLL